MSLTIWKFSLKLTDEQTLELPDGEFLSVQDQNGVLTLWSLVDPAAKKIRLSVRIVGTGHDATDVADCRFLGTVQMHGGALVWHVFVKDLE